ncbi:MAG TPA: pyruvate, phosphate dikinase [Dehalococcoidia bacterium]|nr:pyruvate, phosphate dikinase [Dehalococcoidia bacterium]
MTKYVYDLKEGSKDMRDLLGGKGANLAEMASLDLTVPPAFTITTEACIRFLNQEKQLWPDLLKEIDEHLAALEQKAGKKLGDASNPLLVSVRSGAKFSMPGMMDTILNLGITDETVEGLAKLSDNDRFALDSHRRFIDLFSRVVLQIPGQSFEHPLAEARRKEGVETDAELSPEALREVVRQYKRIAEEQSGQPFPQDAREQLKMAIAAVFNSWNNPRAIAYRTHEGVPHDLGTACNVQAMVFGNFGWDSATGVAFTRDPATGEARLYGEYLPNAQGEDIVAGIRTPKTIADLQQEMPEVYNEFTQVANRLEQHFKDAQDIEFTIERKKLYILQTRSAKRTAAAAVRMAVEMVNESFIDKNTAVQRVTPEDINKLVVPVFKDEAKSAAVDQKRMIGKGLNASPGAASGTLVFDSDEADARAKKGEAVILAREETSADDIHGIFAARGVLTARGGMTSHAAVVTRGLGKPAVVGWQDAHIDVREKILSVNGTTLREGEAISIDGATGEVFTGEIETFIRQPEQIDGFADLLGWADEVRTMGVRTNADSPEDCAKAVQFGAEGVGLCRTEHMFFAPERVERIKGLLQNAEAYASLENRVKELDAEIGAAAAAKKPALQSKLDEAKHAFDSDERAKAYREALAEMEEFQREDFAGLFRVLEGRPLTIRLLDAPLHEFGLHEANPMLGHRGSRLGLTHPGVYDMQMRAIVRAAVEVQKEGVQVEPEVMVPLIGHVNEMRILRERMERVVRETLAELGAAIDFKLGTMIEVPRAALVAGEIAKHADFFSFGSNDLTQMTYGFSRDDTGRFLPDYLTQEILPADPFVTLDSEGVGRLVKLATDEGRAANGKLKVGICGEHGGDADSVAFFHEVGLDYVSCSPYRVPGARLAAAQAALQSTGRSDV